MTARSCLRVLNVLILMMMYKLMQDMSAGWYKVINDGCYWVEVKNL